jgi:hypothetical protein
MLSLFATKFLLPQLLRGVRPPERRVTPAAKARAPRVAWFEDRQVGQRSRSGWRWKSSAVLVQHEDCSSRLAIPRHRRTPSESARVLLAQAGRGVSGLERRLFWRTHEWDDEAGSVRLGLDGQREPANQENEPCRMLE